MGKIFITSDLHLGHNREFLYVPRGFNNIYEHNMAIIENWNKTVDYEDDVYILGDIMLNDNSQGIKDLKSLKGHIHIIRGNHDTDARMELYKDCYNVVEIVDAKFLKYGQYHFFLSHYPCITSNYDEDKPLKARIISIAGHSHTKNKFKDMSNGLIYHVELDAHNNKPVLIDDIIEDIKYFTSLDKNDQKSLSEN